jgi:transcriptional regulator with XRE-family HTH domain
MDDATWQAGLEVLGAQIRAQRSAAGLSLRELAATARVSNAYLSQIERGLHEPSMRVLAALASALGLSLRSLLEPAGLLDESPVNRRSGGAEAAIRSDPALTEPQRLALLSIYRSYVPR